MSEYSYMGYPMSALKVCNDCNCQNGIDAQFRFRHDEPQWRHVHVHVHTHTYHISHITHIHKHIIISEHCVTVMNHFVMISFLLNRNVCSKN